MRHSVVLGFGWILLVGSWAARSESTPSAIEAEYLAELPVVLSASRLPQPLSDAPASVTIIDRETIRLTGARDIVDLFRLVPGMQVSNSWEDAAPNVAYHGGYSYYPSSQMQVLIDGRSVYSPYLIGSVGPGLQTVALDDIERIEVTRGTNSATYGARAMLGVINIVTRHTSETHGLSVQAALGENKISDRGFRYGWGGDSANFRVGVERRGDDGLDGAHDRNRITNATAVADLQLSTRDSLNVSAGNSELLSGRDRGGDPMFPPQRQSWERSHLNLRWARASGADDEISVALGTTHERFFDRYNFPVPAYAGVVVDFGGAANSDNLLFQRITRLDPDARVVWGGEWRREVVESRPMFARSALTERFSRLFGNLEWRFAQAWLLNAGGLVEHNNWDGSYVAPRLAINYQLAPTQTLRLGASKGYRPPSLFEHAANTRYELQGVLLTQSYVARGNVKPEKVTAYELGYLGQIAGPALVADVRIYQEKLSDVIRPVNYDLPPGSHLLGDQVAIDFVNQPPFTLHGIEYQLKGKLWTGGRFTFGQNHLRNGSSDPALRLAAPHRTTAIAVFQRVANDIDASLTVFLASPVVWDTEETKSSRRVDCRLAKRYATSLGKGELALVVQSIGPSNQDYYPYYSSRRRGFVTWQAHF